MMRIVYKEYIRSGGLLTALKGYGSMWFFVESVGNECASNWLPVTLAWLETDHHKYMLVDLTQKQRAAKMREWCARIRV